MSKTTLFGEKHFCASVWILTSTTPKKILLLNHKKLGKWLQPGGHIEQFENPVKAAVREVKEETGLDISFLKDKIDIIAKEGSFLPLPAFLIEQVIPEHNGEPQHYHLDINYVVEVVEQEVKHQKNEALGINWFTKEEALKLPIHKDTRIIINKLL